MTKLNDNEDKLSNQLTNIKIFTEQMYAFGFEIVVGQVKHFFTDKNLDFAILDPTKLVPSTQE